MQRSTLVATMVGGVLPGSVIAAIAAAGFLFGGSAPVAAFTLEGLPEETAHSYHFAESHRPLLEHIPCYCGCDRLGHRNLFDCFLHPAGGYEEHASGCLVCGREATQAERMLAEGAEPHAIRTAIDAAFASYGRGTNTP